MRADDPRHGTYAGANAHWNSGATICDPCKAAATRYQKQRDLRALQGQVTIVPSEISARKLQALVANGHGYAAIGRYMDCSRAQVRSWVVSKHESISVANAERIYAAYEALHMRIPKPVTNSDKRAVTLARNLALRNGWLGPMDWFDIDLGLKWPREEFDRASVDEVLVERIVGGDLDLAKAANQAEKHAIVMRWRASDRSLAELERATGWAAHRYGLTA